MYTIMIVDDEPIIRQGLINFINWSLLECKVIGEASDGIEAQNILQVHSPDIIISDIKMPGTDGIQLAQYIYENHLPIKIILLTGYSDFHYAQSAIKYGVVDFVLKPSTTEKIIDAVDKAKKLIISEREKENKLLHLENKISENIGQIREKFILDLINGVFSDSKVILNKMEQLKVIVDSFYVLVFKLDNNKYLEKDNCPEKNQNFTFQIKNFLGMVFKDFQHYTVASSSKTLCTIISFSNDNHAKSMRSILSKSEEILDIVNNFMSISFSIGISNIHGSIFDIPTAYMEACECLSQKFYNDSSIFIYSQYAANQNNHEKISVNNYIDSIMQHIQSGNGKEAVLGFKSLLENQKASKQPIGHIKTTSILICSLCSKLLHNHNINFENIIQNSDNIYGQILQCDTAETLFEFLKVILETAASYSNSPTTQGNYIIKKALSYIHENYRNPIKLKEIADFVHVNSSYLSRLFRKETGETLTEVIAKLRVEKAKELLRSDAIKAYEVASMVGIDDATYFSHIFKKYTGSSPSEYKYSN